jgi:hypothetical protein
MRFIMNVIDDQSESATDEEMSSINAFNFKLMSEGKFVNAWGLENPFNAKVIDNRTGHPVITSGSHVSTPEYFSGLWIIDAANREEAIGIAVEASRACNRKVEIRATL